MENKKIKVGFTCGSYDLLHAGHVISLRDARLKCDYLIVGLQTDPTLDRKDKNKPVQSVTERLIQLKAVSFVDQIITYTNEKHLLDILEKLEDNIDIRFLGGDWLGKKFTGDNLNIECYFQKRDHGYSSSELRRRVGMAEYNKILKEYERNK